MFAYCNNNPANCVDHSGTRPTWNERDYGNGVVAYNDTGTGRKIVDITDKLTSFMRSKLQEFEEFYAEYGLNATRAYFFWNVLDGSNLDIKLQDEWKFEDGTSYIFRGTCLRYDDTGNIVFGYVGASIFYRYALCAGAGMNQIYKYGFKFGDISTFYDDPRDNYMIKWGYSLYLEDKG